MTDGQVAATATEITAGPADDAQRVDVTFSNTGTVRETLTLTISRNGGTARRLRRVELDVDEQFEITGLALNKTDSLLGITTTASVVDYVVSISAENSPYQMMVYDAYGAPKSAPAVLEQLVQLLG